MLNPRHIAVIGASNRPSNAGRSFVVALRAAGFSGRLSVVNRDGADVDGAAGATSVNALGTVPDLAILAVPAPLAVDAVRELGRAGVRLVHAFTGGFAELGTPDAVDLQRELVSVCHAAGVTLLGPNCMGIYRPRAGLAFRADQPMLDGSVGLVAQSGGVVINTAHQLAAMGVGISTAVSFGNGAQRAAGHWAEQVSATGEQSVLGVYIESANEPDLLDRLAKAAIQQPVIVCAGPSGAEAAAAAARHTGAVGGAAIPREWPPGVVAVRSAEQLMAALAWYARRPLPPTPVRAAIVTISGGVGVAAASALTRAGAVLAQPADATRRAVHEVAGGGLVRAENPVDLGPRYLSRKVAARTLAALRADSGVDVTVFHLTWDHLLDVDRANPGYANGYLDLLLAHGADANDFCIFFPRVLDDLAEHEARTRLRAHGIPVFDNWDAIAAILAGTTAGGRAV